MFSIFSLAEWLFGPTAERVDGVNDKGVRLGRRFHHHGPELLSGVRSAGRELVAEDAARDREGANAPPSRRYWLAPGASDILQY